MTRATGSRIPGAVCRALLGHPLKSLFPQVCPNFGGGAISPSWLPQWKSSMLELHRELGHPQTCPLSAQIGKQAPETKNDMAKVTPWQSQDKGGVCTRIKHVFCAGAEDEGL